jgi:hypothetical protein
MKTLGNNNSSGMLGASISLWVVFAGNIFSGLFLKNLGVGLSQIEDPMASQIAGNLSAAFQLLSHYAPTLMILLVMILQALIILKKPAQLGIDFIGALLTFRCLLQFLMLNFLLLSHLKAGGMLLIQLVLFIPVITIDFGWLYWRIDSAGRSKGRPHIRFSEEMGPLDPFDYFQVAARALMQFEPAGATALTRPMKALFILHGVMMMDLVALTLSRAVSLASGS